MGLLEVVWGGARLSSLIGAGFGSGSGDLWVSVGVGGCRRWCVNSVGLQGAPSEAGGRRGATRGAAAGLLEAI